MGFFSLSAEKSQIQQRTKTITGCGACGLHKTCATPKMGVFGKGRKGIFILAEAPSQAEDRKGAPMIGETGVYLRKVLRNLGIDLEEDCWKMNAINCHTTEPSDAQVSWCHPMVQKEIEEKKPKVIITLGILALQSILHGRWKRGLGGMTRWRGWNIPDRDLATWVCPTFHPAYVTRMRKEPVIERIFLDDLARALSYADVTLPAWKDEKDFVDILETPRRVEEYLHTIATIQPRFLAFDYEASGLKPYAPGQFIKSCSFSYNGLDSASWMWDLMSKDSLNLYRRIMTNQNIGKIASNMKFEDNWSVARVGVKPLNWAWDTMLAAHAMDNRSGITSIKFLTYVHLGRVPYDEHVSHLLESSEKGANGLNSIDEIDPYDLLIYNGLDSSYEFQVAILQMEARYGC